MVPRPRKRIDPMADDDTPETTEETNVTVENTVNDTTGEIEWSVTIKFGSGYDAPWMVGRFSNLDAVTDTVTGREDDLRDAIVKIGKLAAFAAEHAPAAPAPAAGTPSSSGGGARPNPYQAPNGETRECKHGKMRYRTKVEGGETKWRAFFCDTPKGTPDQCKPQFIND